MALLGDRVQETTTTTGTGTFALNGAVTGYVTFNSTFSNGDIVWYVADDGAGNWEIGYGSVGTGTLSRTVFQSSNSNNLVSFAAGAKRLFCSAPYTYYLPNQTGQSGKVLTTDGTTPSWVSTGGVTSVSVTTANGFAGTSSGGATPALTLSTSVTGLLKGNGTAVSAAVAGTDYAGLASANTFTDNQIISVSSASDALRITQTGTGNALVVEDSANPDSTPFIVDASGRVGIGGTPNAGSTLHLAKAITGATTSYGLLNNNVIQSDVTADAQYYNAVGNTAAAAFTLPALRGYYYRQATFGAGSAVTNQYGFFTESDVTGATNNFGFYSSIASGTGRWNFYAAGTAANYFAGKIGIGTGAPFADTSGISFGNNLTGGTTQNAHNVYATISSDVTATARGYNSQLQTAAAAFTLNAIHHFNAAQIAIGAGSTVTNQVGFQAAGNLTGATNNYGFYSAIASGTGRYNFYAAGTADNYLAGNLGIGTSSPGQKLDVAGSGRFLTPNVGTTGAVILRDDATNASSGYLQWVNNAGSTQYGWIKGLSGGGLSFSATGSENMRLDSSGNLGIGTSSPGYKLDVAGNARVGNVYGTGLTVTVAGNSITYPADNTLAFNTNSTERMRLDSSGNLGLGVTPSGWSSLARAEQIGSRTSVFNFNNSNTYLTHNHYINTSNQDIYLANDYATMYRQSSGIHYWYTAPSGTAGNAISFTQAMTLDASGNLLVGDTSGPTNARFYAVHSVSNAGVGFIRNLSTSYTDSVFTVSSATASGTGFNLLRLQHATGTCCQVLGNGNVQNTNNAYGAISDKSLKENIVDATPKLANLLRVKIRNFNLIGNSTKQIGVVAQELEEVFPAMVEEDGDGVKSVKYSVFVPMLVKAIQELSAELNELKQKVNA